MNLDPSPPDPPEAVHQTALEWATVNELIQEMSKRFENLIIYGETDQPKEGWKYHFHRSGDIVRLHGAVELRVLPLLEKEHDERFEFKSNEEPEE